MINKNEKKNKYKLTLLKDLPNFKAVTEVLNITEDEFTGKTDYEYRNYIDEMNFSQIYDLRNNPEWVKTEIDSRCDCFTKDKVIFFYRIISYGRTVLTTVDFKRKVISSWYDIQCDCGKEYKLPISFCPLCGRKL